MEDAEPLTDADLDLVISQLLAVRQEPPGKLVNLEESLIERVCKRAKIIFLQQPPLLELDGPVNIVGELPCSGAQRAANQRMLSQVMCTASTTTCCGCSKWAAFLRLTSLICSLGEWWIQAKGW